MFEVQLYPYSIPVFHVATGFTVHHFTSLWQFSKGPILSVNNFTALQQDNGLNALYSLATTGLPVLHFLGEASKSKEIHLL